MAEFFVPKTNEEIAVDIANLLNQHNRLNKVHNQFTIIGSPIRYYVEFGQFVDNGVAISRVVGCIGLDVENPSFTRIRHLCVDLQFRGMGLAKKLISLALTFCQTSGIYMIVRDDNKACHRAAFHNGFVPNGIMARDNYNLITLSRSV